MLWLSILVLGCAAAPPSPATPAATPQKSSTKDDPARCVTPASISSTDEEPEAAEVHRRVDQRLAELGACTKALKERGWLGLQLTSADEESKAAVTLESSTVENCAVAECIRTGLTEVALGSTDVSEIVELVPGAPPRRAIQLDAPTSAKARAGKRCIDESASPRPRLPPPVIQGVVRSHYDELRRCYEAGLGRDPQLTGRVTTRFMIDRNGSVIDANIDTNALPDCQVTTCMLGVFRRLAFPKPRGGRVIVVYPIVFEPDQPAHPSTTSDPQHQAAFDEAWSPEGSRDGDAVCIAAQSAPHE